jgi:hypothetical protein
LSMGHQAMRGGLSQPSASYDPPAQRGKLQH